MSILFNYYPQIYSLIKVLYEKVVIFWFGCLPFFNYYIFLQLIFFFKSSLDDYFKWFYCWRIYSAQEWTCSNILLYGEGLFNANPFPFSAMLRKNSEMCISKSISFKSLCFSAISLRWKKEFWCQFGTSFRRG